MGWQDNYARRRLKGQQVMKPEAAKLKNLLIKAYIVTVCLITASIAVKTWSLPATDSWLMILTLAVLTVAARRWQIDLYGRGSTSTAIVIQATGALLFGPTVGVFLGLVSGLVRWPWKKAPRVYMFDAGMFALTAGLIGLLPSVVDQDTATTQINIIFLLGSGFMVSAVAYVSNMGLLTGVMALDERLSPLTIWRERFAWLTTTYAVFGVMAVGMALAGKSLGIIGLLIFAMPVFAMRLITQQYIQRTKANVDQLRAANDALRLAHDELAEKHEALGRAYAATRTAFSGMLNARDNETEGHSERVVGYALVLGEELGLAPQELADLEVGALLHDIGKVGVPDAILHKPGPLTSEEWAEMRRHPELGSDLVSEIPFLSSALPVVRHHHERWDGTGYPDKLRGEDIPLFARIFSIADVYDALISDRPYRPAMSSAVAIAEIERGAGSQFDPAVVAAFSKLILSGTFTRPYLRRVDTEARRSPAVTFRRRAADWQDTTPSPQQVPVPTVGS